MIGSTALPALCIVDPIHIARVRLVAIGPGWAAHGPTDRGVASDGTPDALPEIPEMPESPNGLHPLGETAIMRTAVSCDGLGPSGFEVKRAIGRGRRGAPAARSVAHARQRTSSMPSLELGRRSIVERGVQALDVVDPVDEVADRALGGASITVEGAVDLLGLERAHEALGLGVVVGIADPAHARGDAMSRQHLGVVAAGVLGALVGVMDQAARPGLALLDGHL